MKDAMQDAMHVRFKMAPAKGACHHFCVDFRSASVPDVRALLSLHEVIPNMVNSKQLATRFTKCCIFPVGITFPLYKS